ncbi:hypothetical protein M0R04_08715 [Candidatus Dojkabacteria bacterium]|jgi:hypothetical protein|nr:hypothetical protein [Candidatus Dojkabacteria bacterium]
MTNMTTPKGMREDKRFCHVFVNVISIKDLILLFNGIFGLIKRLKWDTGSFCESKQKRKCMIKKMKGGMTKTT